MRVDCYYTIEGKAVYDKKRILAGWKPIGIWVLSGDTILFKFLPGNEEAVRRAKQALIRADDMFGKERGMDQLRYIIATASGYIANHTIIKKTKKFSSASACIKSLLAGLTGLRCGSQDWVCSIWSSSVDRSLDR